MMSINTVNVFTYDIVLVSTYQHYDMILWSRSRSPRSMASPGTFAFVGVPHAEGGLPPFTVSEVRGSAGIQKDSVDVRR